MALRLGLLTFAKLLILTVVVAICLSEVYGLANRSLGLSAWQGPALCNSFLAVFVALLLPQAVRWRPFIGNGASWHLWLVPILTVVGALLLAMASKASISGEIPPVAIDYRQLAFVIWIPVVEEIVFRAGFGTVFRRLGGPIWGSYFAALLFALVHAHPSLANVMILNVGLPLGPFALGLLCEYMYQKSGGLALPVAVHAACNSTVVIFGLIDGRWLTDWLSLFYT